MTRPPQRDLFVSERPVRSDFARGDASRERAYAVRRRITLSVLAIILLGGAYAVWGRGPGNPADIPTIKAEGAYKQKPADPGGIDIPHQDVRVYDQLETKAGNAAQIEHLLPAAEIPKDAPRPAPPVPPTASAFEQPAPPAAAPPVNDDVLSDNRTVKPVATTVAPPPVAAPVPPVTTPAPQTMSPPPAAKSTVAPKQEAVSIDQVIANTKASATATPAGNNAAASGDAIIQLASVPDQAKAQDMARNLQSKYSDALGSATLHVVRADLGKRGITYRIQSQGLSESEADHICSTLKQSNAGCILVRK